MGFAHETRNAERGRVWPGRYVCGSSLPRTSTLRDAIARAGVLPLEIIRMKAKGCEVVLHSNNPGFTLPSNIGELGDDITELNLSECSLTGAFWDEPDIPHCRPRAHRAN